MPIDRPAREGSLTVVVADDSPAARALLQATLRGREGIHVVGVASDGRVAVQLVERERPQLVILDVAMPDMDGLEAAARVRELGLDTRIIVLSAYNSDRMAASALAAGADVYVEKAAPNEELFAAISRLFPSLALAEPSMQPVPSAGPPAAAVWPHEGDESPGEQRYRLLLDALDEGVLVVDGQGVVTSVNFSATRILRRPTSAIVGRPASQFGVDTAADSPCPRPVSATLGTGRPWSNLPVVITDGHGHRRDLLLSVRPLGGEGPAAPAEVLVSFADVTDLRRSEERYRQTAETLRDEKELLERLFSTVQVLIAHLDRDFAFVRVNAAYAAADGHDPDFFVGKNHFDLYPDEENEAIFRRVVATGEPYAAYEKPFVYSDNPERGVTYWDWNVWPVRAAGGEVEGLMFTLVDRSERARLRHELETVRREVVAGGGPFRAALDAMLDAVFLCEAVRDDAGDVVDLRYTFANPAAVDVRGRRVEELVGHRLLRLYPAMAASALYAGYLRVIETGEPFRVEGFRYDDVIDGHQVSGVYDVQAVRHGDGVLVTYRRVAERELRLVELAAQEERFRQALDNLLDSFALLSAVRVDGRIVDFHIDFANREVLDVAGRGRDELVGARLVSLYPNARRSGLLEQLTRVVETGEPLVLDGHRYDDVDAAGRAVGGVFDVRATRLGDDGCILVWRDVSESWSAQEALRESEARFRLAAERAPIGMALVGVDGRFLLVNPALCELLGRSATELTATTLRRLTHPEDVAADVTLVERTLAGEIDGYERDKRYLHRDGHVVWTHVVVTLVRDHVGYPRHFYVQIVDVGERRRAGRQLADAHAALERRARQLERANADLARANAELAEFAYVASHDLREPLRTVAGFAELLAERAQDRLDADEAEFVDFIRQGVDRMQELISALLAYSRVGTHPAAPGSVDTRALVDEVLHALAAKIEASGAEVSVGELPVVTADRVQLSQLFQNLIANALTFVAPGVAPRVSVTAEPATGGWRFTVSDNGIGIKPEHREKVFRMFQRLHAPDRYPGSGMGLAICKRIVERHGGSIDVDDNPGGGTRFCFTLPSTPASPGVTAATR